MLSAVIVCIIVLVVLFVVLTSLLRISAVNAMLVPRLHAVRDYISESLSAADTLRFCDVIITNKAEVVRFYHHVCTEEKDKQACRALHGTLTLGSIVVLDADTDVDGVYVLVEDGLLIVGAKPSDASSLQILGGSGTTTMSS